MPIDQDATSANGAGAAPQQGRSWTRWLPLIVIAGLMGLVFAMGWHQYLSFKTIGLNYEALRTFIDGNLVVALSYLCACVLCAGSSVPRRGSRTCSLRFPDRR